MYELTKFRELSDKLVEFIDNWIELLDEKCENNIASNQQKASCYLWNGQDIQRRRVAASSAVPAKAGT
jgi:hypothetical protein